VTATASLPWFPPWLPRYDIGAALAIFAEVLEGAGVPLPRVPRATRRAA
jgi:hypothetical protein